MNEMLFAIKDDWLERGTHASYVLFVRLFIAVEGCCKNQGNRGLNQVRGSGYEIEVEGIDLTRGKVFRSSNF